MNLGNRLATRHRATFRSQLRRCVFVVSFTVDSQLLDKKRKKAQVQFAVGSGSCRLPKCPFSTCRTATIDTSWSWKPRRVAAGELPLLEESTIAGKAVDMVAACDFPTEHAG